MDNDNDSSSESAESLHLQGNDAFSTKDWERAATLYRQSIKVSDQQQQQQQQQQTTTTSNSKSNPKTFSNLAATLCKLGKYEEASRAAKRGTTIPNGRKWSKGWWRRGVVAELMKDPVTALKFFQCALDLEPNSKAYQQALHRMERKLDVNKYYNDMDDDTTTTSSNNNSSSSRVNRLPIVENHNSTKRNSSAFAKMVMPTRNAYLKVMNELDNPPSVMLLKMYQKHLTQTTSSSSSLSPTSEQYLITGFAQWVNGLQGAVASTTIELNSQAQMLLLNLSMNREEQRCRGARRTTISTNSSSSVDANSHVDANENVHTDADADANVTFYKQCDELLGGTPTGHHFESLVSGFGYLFGDHIFLEFGSNGRNNNNNGNNDELSCFLPPSSQFIPNGLPIQMLACYNSIHACLMQTIEMLKSYITNNDNDNKHKFVCCKGVLSASQVFTANLRIPTHTIISKCINDNDDTNNNECDDPTPQECVNYMIQLLKDGYTWDNVVRKYCMLLYQGSMLHGCFIRLMTGPAGFVSAYKSQKWAIDFITLADDVFHVSDNESYDMMGDSFRKTLQLGLNIAFYKTHETLRNDNVNGPYSMEMSLDILTDIIDMVQDIQTSNVTCKTYDCCYDDHDHDNNNLEYTKTQFDVAMKRKPLALAHSSIAAILTQIRSIFPYQEFKQIASHHGFIESEDMDIDPYELVANHYKIAAENELQDDPNASIYWYGYSANMCLAHPKSGYTIGMVRGAIRKARIAEERRDDIIFGIDQRQGCNTLGILSEMTIEHYNTKEDTFILPQLEIDHTSAAMDGKSILKCGNTILCDSWDTYEKINLEKERQISGIVDPKQILDNRDAVEKHGSRLLKYIPSLETLCVRALHKAGNDFSKGESDGSVIIHKAMMAGYTEEK